MKKKKRINLNAKEFNKKLEYVKNFCEIKYNEEIKNPIGANAYIIDKISNIELTFKDPDNSFKPITYIFDKSCSANVHQKMGVDAWATLQKYYKIPHVANKEEAMEYFNSTVSGILYSSPYFTGERHYAYGYDMNSAFSWGMLQDMPKDTEKGPINLDKNKEPILRKKCRLHLLNLLMFGITEKRMPKQLKKKQLQKICLLCVLVLCKDITFG